MKNNLLKIFICLLVLCVLLLFYALFSPKTLKNNSNFKALYNKRDNIKVYLRKSENEKIEVTDRSDIYDILDTLKDEKIKNVGSGDTIIGGDYYVLFFMIDDKCINMSFCGDQVNVLDKQYYIERSVKEKLKNITEKYE